MPDVLPTVATEVLLEVQDTLVVRSCVEASLNVPVAVKCACAPVGMLLLAGVIAMEVMVAFVMVKGTESVTEPRVAVTVTLPAPVPKANPLPAPIESNAGFDDDQVT